MSAPEIAVAGWYARNQAYHCAQIVRRTGGSRTIRCFARQQVSRLAADALFAGACNVVFVPKRMVLYNT